MQKDLILLVLVFRLNSYALCWNRKKNPREARQILYIAEKYHRQFILMGLGIDVLCNGGDLPFLELWSDENVYVWTLLWISQQFSTLSGALRRKSYPLRHTSTKALNTKFSIWRLIRVGYRRLHRQTMIILQFRLEETFFSKHWFQYFRTV